MRHTRTHALLAVVVAVGVCLPPAVFADPLPIDTEVVDCTDPDPKKHDSINDALTNSAIELIIEISGFCEERVVVERDNVTLRGSDPALDGIEGPTADSSYRALVDVNNARVIRLENLTITRSLGRGVEGTGTRSWVELSNCRIVENDFRGLQTNGYLLAEDSLIADNGNLDLLAWTGGNLACTRCTIEDDEGTLAWAVGWITLRDSSMSTGGDIAAWAVTAGSTLTGINSSASATLWSVGATEFGEIWWRDGELDGSLYVDWKSLVTLLRVDETANPEGNYIGQDSTLQAWDSTLPGVTYLTEFSNGAVRGGDVGDLHCDLGSDLYCDGGDPDSSSCGLCPVAVAGPESNWMSRTPEPRPEHTPLRPTPLDQ